MIPTRPARDSEIAFSNSGELELDNKYFPVIRKHLYQSAFPGLSGTDQHHTGKITEIFMYKLLILPFHTMQNKTTVLKIQSKKSFYFQND